MTEKEPNAMKRLKDEVSLNGKLETISMMDLRSRPGEVLESVSLGKTYIIAKNGKPIAVLSRLPGEQLSINVERDGSVTHSR
jgi:hypothetical protein